MRTEPQDELFKLVEENLEVSKKVLRSVEKTQKSLFWMNVAQWVRAVVWIIPLVLAAIYLPRLVKTLEDRVNQFQQGFDIQKAVEQFRSAQPKQ